MSNTAHPQSSNKQHLYLYKLITSGAENKQRWHHSEKLCSTSANSIWWQSIVHILVFCLELDYLSLCFCFFDELDSHAFARSCSRYDPPHLHPQISYKTASTAGFSSTLFFVALEKCSRLSFVPKMAVMMHSKMHVLFFNSNKTLRKLTWFKNLLLLYLHIKLLCI